METLEQKRLRAIEAGVSNDGIYANKTNIFYTFVKPIMGGKISDIEFVDKHVVDARLSEEVQDEHSLYQLYRIDGDKTNTLYVITENGIIKYYTFSPSFQRASAAWETLTGVFIYGRSATDWIYCGLTPLVYTSISPVSNERRVNDYLVLKNVDEQVNDLYYHY